MEMPPNRARPLILGLSRKCGRHFWQQLDTDGNGKADFSEFFPWWLKYFHSKAGALNKEAVALEDGNGEELVGQAL